MEVVIDSNILFRTLISHGAILALIFDEKLHLFAPERLKEEFLNNREEILRKSTLSKEEFEELASLMFERLCFVPLESYKEFLPKAKELLGEHGKDEDFIALCLMKRLKLWTYEKRIFSIDYGISTREIATELYGL